MPESLMVNSREDQIPAISQVDLPEIVARAKAEAWQDLALIGPNGYWRVPQISSAYTNIFRVNPELRDISRLVVLDKLQFLDLSGNLLGVEGGYAVAKLESLRSLCLWNNEIGDEGAFALSKLSSLISLDLGVNSLGPAGARSLSNLDQLKHLILYNNWIGSEGARALSALKFLSTLDLRGNNIKDEGVWCLLTLPHLRELILRSNNIGDNGARALSILRGLKRLDLRSNNIGPIGAQALLDAWADSPDFERLETLDLRENQDLSSLLAPELLKTIDAHSILAAYRRFRSADLEPLNEAKLLVVGGEAVGKTSLVRFLARGTARNPSEAKTSGISQEKIETQTWRPEQSNVVLHVWDFGGQEIMHETHRFFLTERSLYILVLENRKEDDRSIYHWLKAIRSRGGDSPIIVVINKCDENRQMLRLNESELTVSFPQIISFIPTCCNPDPSAVKSIARLREAIINTLNDDMRLKHVRDPIPRAWRRVKEVVARRAEEARILEVQEFWRICENADGDLAITDTNEQRALLRLLHDLGVVVAHGYNKDKSSFGEVTLLDPNWLTAAIYTLLNSHRVRDQGGEFSRGQMVELLGQKEYAERECTFILDMMQDEEIGLCFELPDGDGSQYLIPEALPASAPWYGNWPDDALYFRFRYERLPSGLIPRFIVQAHRNLTDPPTRWRTGAVLEVRGCPVLVRGSLEKSLIDVRVDGPGGLKRAALNVVLDDLESVHARNPEIGAEARVPLPDQPERDVSYQHLLRLERERGPNYSYWPDNAKRPYPVQELLQGVRRKHQGSEFTEERQTRQHPEVAQDTVSPDILTSNSWWITVSSWPFVSVVCGLGAAVTAGAIWLLAEEWRLYAGVAIGIVFFVTLVVLSFNPRFFYRRWLSVVIPAGPLQAALGFQLNFSPVGASEKGWISWNSTPSPTFFAAWALVVAVLAWADCRRAQ